MGVLAGQRGAGPPAADRRPPDVPHIPINSQGRPRQLAPDPDRPLTSRDLAVRRTHPSCSLHPRPVETPCWPPASRCHHVTSITSAARARSAQAGDRGPVTTRMSQDLGKLEGKETRHLSNCVVSSLPVVESVLNARTKIMEHSDKSRE